MSTISGNVALMDDWGRIEVGGDGPWERNHPSLIDDKVDPESSNLETPKYRAQASIGHCENRNLVEISVASRSLRSLAAITV